MTANGTAEWELQECLQAIDQFEHNLKVDSSQFSKRLQTVAGVCQVATGCCFWIDKPRL